MVTRVSIVYSTVLFRRRSKKTSKLFVTGLCEAYSPVTGEFPAQKASNAENVSIIISVIISRLRWSIRYFDDLAQDCANSSVLAMGLLYSCAQPSIYSYSVSIGINKGSTVPLLECINDLFARYLNWKILTSQHMDGGGVCVCVRRFMVAIVIRDCNTDL